MLIILVGYQNGVEIDDVERIPEIMSRAWTTR